MYKSTLSFRWNFLVWLSLETYPSNYKSSKHHIQHHYQHFHAEYKMCKKNKKATFSCDKRECCKRFGLHNSIGLKNCLVTKLVSLCAICHRVPGATFSTKLIIRWMRHQLCTRKQIKKETKVLTVSPWHANCYDRESIRAWEKCLNHTQLSMAVTRDCKAIK